MASRQAALQLLALFILAAAFSSFTLIHADDSSKSDEHASKEVSASDDSSAQEDSKEKRSQEEIMFGNQQNKPNGLVDDLMGMSENGEEDDSSASVLPDKKTAGAQDDEHSSNDEAKDSKDEKRAPAPEDQPNDMMMGSGAENWYNTLPVSPSAMQYLANSQAMKTMPASEDFSNSLYDQEDLYRRKRQLINHHGLPLQKRSLRSSLGQMIQKRGIRMPRRSMRLKRQVDMEDLLNLFGNERFYDEDQQMTPHIFGGRSQTVAKRHVPGRFSGYPETPAPEFRYPYVFQHRDNGILSANNDMDENSDALDGETMEDIDSLMLLPPNARYSDLAQYGSRDEEKEAIQSWLNRHTVPSVFRVSRRSAPYFYPVDYRYIPGYKKRSSFRNRNRDLGRFSNDDDTEADFGKWGHVVQVPEAYASPEDVARLYGLANLMAEEDEPEAKMRRSA
ncbi:uncharacterized protein LOC129984502 isoform X1 [Argiope bruennichi]|uniref:uncharacterized protein LOC129984502 isoform X1 n=1 Tax=Argiope bruennichi TaxID=94029 RepID=UPI002494B5C6|nr:uncharacterized protein LOC129984502 isoform X1 [Argiope bruennichi]